MAGFRVNLFKGIRPRISKRKLPLGEAQTAKNVRLGSGDLRVWHGPRTEFVLDSVNTQTIYQFDNGGNPLWFEWTSDVDVARGALKDDSIERTYYTGDGFPKMTYTTIADGAAPLPADWRRLGLPAPAAAPTVTAPAISSTIVGNTATITDGMAADKFYLTVLNIIWEQVNGNVPPDDERVFVRSDLAGLGEPLDVGFEVGMVFKVTVIDANTFSITNEASEFLSKSPIPTSPRDGSQPDSTLFMKDEGGGFANFAGFMHAPQGLIVTQVGHGLFNDSEILITNVGVPVRYDYNSPSTADPGGAFGPLPYFLVDYPNTGPYPKGPDNTEQSTHECTYDVVGDHFTLEGSWTYEVINEGQGSQDTVESRSYAYTYVTALGEEGPPSAASAPESVIDGTGVTIGSFSAPPGAGAGYDITNIRIYRTNSTQIGAEFQFVAEILDDAVDYNDTIENASLGELLPSTDWDRPDQDMQGIITLPNGMMAGFKGKTLFLCEPYFPHAWPAVYDQAVDYPIVGLGAIGNTIVIITEGWPYITTGSHPRNINIRPFKINQSGSSKKSIATLNDRVLYASPDGIIEIGINGYRNVTANFFTKEEWEKQAPSTMIAEVHDDKYIAFNSPPIAGAGSATVEDYEAYARTFYNSPATLGDFVYTTTGIQVQIIDGAQLEVGAVGSTLRVSGSSQFDTTIIKRDDDTSFSVTEMQFAFSTFDPASSSIDVVGYSTTDATGTPVGTVVVPTDNSGVLIIATINLSGVKSIKIETTQGQLGQSELNIVEFTSYLGSLAGGPGAIIFNPDDETIGFSTSDTEGNATYLDIDDDILYYSKDDTVYEWDNDEDNPLQIEWLSGQFHMTHPMNMGAGIVEADSYPVTFELIADGTSRATRTVSSDVPFRLPGGYLASTFEVKITGAKQVTEVKVAENIFELAEG